ncbi:MAG: hypothetical protein MRY79_04820 [Alphaproteobacteria bacterium]|nr:hypothetical protein [Alphaproteobacteria bacterium]
MDSQDKQFDDDDDMLDADFEDGYGDDEFDDVDLPEEDSFDDGFGDELGDEFSDIQEEEEDLYPFDDFDDDDEDEDEGEGLAPGAGLRKTGGGFEIDLSFNAIAIIAALGLGVLVLGYQLVTNKPAVVERFVSAIGMVGLTDGPIFGGEKEGNADGTLTMDQVQDKNKQKTGGKNDQGFLYEPDILKDMEMAPRIDDTPPMPTPIVATVEEETPSTINQQVPRSPPDYGAIFDSRDKAPLPDTPVDEAPAQTEKEKPVTQKADEVSKQVPQKTKDDFEQDDMFSKKDTVDTFGEALGDVTGDVMGTNALGLEEVTSPTEQQRQMPETKVVEQVVEEAVAEPSIQEVVETTPEKAISKVSQDNTQPEPSSSLPDPVNPVSSQLQEAQQRIEELQKNEDTYRAEIESLKGKIEELSAKQSVMAQSAKPSNTVPKTTSGQAPKKKIATRKSSAPAGKWELRAAMPGKAWVAKKGQRILTPVIVGDTIEGMGRVRSIDLVSGRWVVKTSKGQIRQ